LLRLGMMFLSKIEDSIVKKVFWNKLQMPTFIQVLR
jgi:hypothetical protein